MNQTSAQILVALSILGVMVAGWLYVMARGYFLRITKRHLEITDRVRQQSVILYSNKRILNSIECNLFEAKEHGLNMYDHYAAMLRVLDDVAENDNLEALAQAQRITYDGMQIVADAFTNTFGMTPEQWRGQRFRATLRNKITGTDEESQCSVN